MPTATVVSRRTKEESQRSTLGDFDCATGLINILWSRDDLIVRNATYKDAAIIDKLQKDNSYAVGFIQKTIWDKYVFGGERNFFVLIVESNNDPVGYTLITPGRGMGSYLRIQQIEVRDDARRLKYGNALMAVIERFANEQNRAGARLRCRADLQSNHFWQAMGFTVENVVRKGAVNHVGFKASNDINLWMREFSQVPRLFVPERGMNPVLSGDAFLQLGGKDE
jgi:GNAT superfamily N-acetyltransferase